MDESERLKSNFARNSRWAGWSGQAIVAGLALDIIFLLLFSADKSWIETAALIFATFVIGAGVWLEIHFGHKAGIAALSLEQISDEKVAAAEDRATEAQFRANSSMGLAADAQSRASRAQREAGKAHQRAAELEKETETLRLAVAEANARTAEAELKLEQLRKLVAPRLITQAQQNELAAKLSEFKNQRETVVASPSTPESEMFARWLTAPLKAAGWEMEVLPGTATATVLFPTGILVSYAVDMSKPVIFPEKTERAEAANALVEKLKEYGIDATAVAGLVKPPNTIEIIISTK